MKISVQSIHFDADVLLLEFIQKKANKLDQFFDKIIDGEAILRVEKSSEDKKNKIVEVKVRVPGIVLFAKEQCKTFEEAAELVFESLKKQLQRHKEKVTEHSVDSESIYLDEMAD